MIKYFCDECGIEVSDPSGSLDMTGKVLCGKHYVEYQKRNENTRWEYKKVWNNGRFDFRKGVRKIEDVPN